MLSVVDVLILVIKFDEVVCLFDDMLLLVSVECEVLEVVLVRCIVKVLLVFVFVFVFDG